MYNVSYNIQANLVPFRMENYGFRYNDFVPRLYNLCLDIGFEPGKILPSTAFCSDTSQGIPVILLAKHFGVFPFDHGQEGGIMACERHRAHAHHGQDIVIVQASHIAYDSEQRKFGAFHYPHTEHSECSSTCGKISDALSQYLSRYHFACNHIFVDMHRDHCYLTIDNQYLLSNHQQALRLKLDKMLKQGINNEIIPVKVKSTASTFIASEQFCKHMRWFFEVNEGDQPIGDALLPEYFSFDTNLGNVDGSRQVEQNIVGVMSEIVTSVDPMLTAAQANTQAEFDRAFRSIAQESAYKNKNLLYISGLHIDIPPSKGQKFVQTKFIPWAAYIQLKNGERYLLEQEQLYQKIKTSKDENLAQLNFDKMI